MNLAKIDTIIDGNEESQIVAIGDSGAVIGTVCLAHKKKRSACITQFYICESSRRQGVGSKLIEACCDIAKESGCETIGLSLDNGNDSAEFYRKSGFRFCYQYENGDSLLAFFLNPVWHGESKGEWLPISTAPKDSIILVFAPGKEGLESLTSACTWHYQAGFCIDEIREATHWMPIPSPPQENNHE